MTATPPSLLALAARFLHLGLTAFGGPVVQIGNLHRQLVEQERWVDEAAFRRALALYQALPGPEATEMCIWFGGAVRGRLGGLIAGLCFVLPGLLLMLLASAWLYALDPWPAWLQRVLFGMQAGIVGLVVLAVFRLGRRTFRSNRGTVPVALGALAGAAAGAPFWVALLCGGLFLLALDLPRRLSAFASAERGRPGLAALIAVGGALAGWWLATPASATAAVSTTASALPPTAPPLLDIATTGLRAGLLTFGGAYTAIPFLERDAVVVGGWLDHRQFLSGLAIGSALPAPMVIVGTWVGWAGGGLAGALLLTLGIFLPAFGFPLLLHDWLERIVGWRPLHAFLDGIAAAVIGLMAWTALTMAERVAGSPVGATTAIGTLLLVAASPQRWITPLAMGLAAVGGYLGGGS